MTHSGFALLVGTHRKFVVRKIKQLFSGEAVSLEEEVEILKKFNFNPVTTRTLTNLATSIYHSKVKLKNGVFALKLDSFIYLLHHKGKTSFLNANEFVVELENLIKEAVLEYDEAFLSEIIHFIHNYLEYFPIGSAKLIKLYRTEALHSNIELLKNVFSEDDILFKTFYGKAKEDFSRTLSVLEKDMTFTVRVWLLRELYYFYSHLSGLEKDDFIESYRSLITGNEQSFRNVTENNGLTHFGCTNPDTYLTAVRTFNATKSVPPLVRFNILLNLSHCNGTMATKCIRVRPKDLKPGINSVIEFLDKLSEGAYTKDIPYLIYKELGVLPHWFIGK